MQRAARTVAASMDRQDQSVPSSPHSSIFLVCDQVSGFAVDYNPLDASLQQATLQQPQGAADHGSFADRAQI